MRVLLLGGSEERYHHFDEVGPPLQELIRSAGHTCRPALAQQVLDRKTLGGFDAIVSATTGGELSDEQEHALLSAVTTTRNDRNRAVPFLGLHGAACSFTRSNAYSKMLGGRFVSHPPMAAVRVRPCREHPVTRAVASFEIVDELYELELTGPIELLLEGTLISKGSVPQVPLGWVRSHGVGTVVYLALGHGRDQLSHPSLRQLVKNTLCWFEQSLG